MSAVEPNWCTVCGSQAFGSTAFEVSEAFFGLSKTYRYVECSSCKSIVRASKPSVINELYPANYYSLLGSNRSLVRYVAQTARDQLAFRFSIWRKPWAGDRVGFEILRGLRDFGLTVGARVLDVGCGDGKLLRRLRNLGFTRLVGADPYVPEEGNVGGVTLLRRELGDVDGKFDVVMFNHSLEHIVDPLHTLGEAKSRLAPGGSVIVRIPVAGSSAHRSYGASWVALDAPRHTFVPTVAGMKRLSARAGLETVAVRFDSHAYQFFGSELVKRGLSIHENGRKATELFGRAQIAFWQAQSAALNDAGDGDQAAFLLRPS